MRDDFFYNASFTMFSGPRLHGFSTSNISAYKATLTQYLERVSEAAEEDTLSNSSKRGRRRDLHTSSNSDIPVELKWKHWGNVTDKCPGLSADVTYTLDMIFIRYNRSLHRLCIVTRHHLKDQRDILLKSVVVIANAAPEVLDVCRYWIAKQFDTALVPFEMDQRVILKEYDRYLKASSRASGFGTDSELWFGVQDSYSKKLREIVIAVSGQDLPAYLANG